MPYASVLNGTRMGRNNRVYQGAIIGADPQDFRWKGETTYCFIGDNNTIRENVIINRGITSAGGTRIGNDNFIMAKCHIGHDSHIKGRCVLGNGVTMAGDCDIDECCILSSNCIVHEDSKIGKWNLIKGGCRIAGNVPPYIIVAHNPVASLDQSGISVYNALQRIEADIEPSEIRSEILNFVRSNNLRIVAIPSDMLD